MTKAIIACAFVLQGCGSLPTVCPSATIHVVNSPGGTFYVINQKNLTALAETLKGLSAGTCTLKGR